MAVGFKCRFTDGVIAKKFLDGDSCSYRGSRRRGARGYRPGGGGKDEGIGLPIGMMSRYECDV